MKKKQMALSPKYLINMVSLVIFVVAYLYIYSSYEKKAQDIYTEVGLRKQRLQLNLERAERKDEVVAKTAALEAAISRIVDSYPLHISKVDNLLFIKKMEDQLGIKFKMVDSTNAKAIYDTGLPAKAIQLRDEPATITGMEAMVALNFQTDYKGLKKMVDYIINYPEHTIIDSLSVSRDNTTNSLTGSIVIKRYALSGTGKPYAEPVIDDISIGRDNIFGLDSDD